MKWVGCLPARCPFTPFSLRMGCGLLVMIEWPSSKSNSTLFHFTLILSLPAAQQIELIKEKERRRAAGAEHKRESCPTELQWN